MPPKKKEPTKKDTNRAKEDWSEETEVEDYSEETEAGDKPPTLESVPEVANTEHKVEQPKVVEINDPESRGAVSTNEKDDTDPAKAEQPAKPGEDKGPSADEVSANEAVQAVKGDTAPMQPIYNPDPNPSQRPMRRRGERTFIVAKGKVGDFSYGEKIKLSQLPKGTDINRLINLGAVSEVDPD